MSTMAKFMQQTCSFERALRERSGDTKLNKFGDVLYASPKTLKCRRERVIKDVQTNTGAILSSSTRYFLDESQTLNPDDKLDGKAILELEEYVDAQGRVVGYEVYV